MEPTRHIESSNLRIINQRNTHPVQSSLPFVAPATSSQRPVTSILATNLSQASTYPSRQIGFISNGQAFNPAPQIQELSRAMDNFPHFTQRQLVRHLASTSPFHPIPSEHVASYIISLGSNIIRVAQQSDEHGRTIEVVGRLIDRFRRWDQERGLRATFANHSSHHTVQRSDYFFHITHEIAPRSSQR